MPPPLKKAYPFNIPAIRKLRRLNFQRNVTFFVGENGTEKSTLLERLWRSGSALGLRGGLRTIFYEESDHFSVTRHFLNDYKRQHKHLRTQAHDLRRTAPSKRAAENWSILPPLHTLGAMFRKMKARDHGFPSKAGDGKEV